MHKKIICTVGPSSLNENTIKKMEDAGVDLFRINLSHTEIDEFLTIVENMKRWTNKPICPDTEGAQLRTSLLIDQRLVKEYEIVEFVNKRNLSNNNKIGITGNDIQNIFKNGDLITIDFDGVVVQIIEKSYHKIIGRVLHPGKIGNNKGINVDRLINLDSFTTKDKKIFKISHSIGIKHFFLSFCSEKSDVISLRNKFSYDIEIISKIESKKGLLNLDGICKESNAILIDRGDLSRDVPLEKIPMAQQHIIENAKITNTPVYVATNLMENMILNSKPTRAEVNDIKSTLNSGAKGLVLAAETAIGNYPVECVRILSRIMNETENYEKNKALDKLFHLPSDRMINPHGGMLVQQFSNQSFDNNSDAIFVDDEIYLDIHQIANGTFSPINSFMSYEEINYVLNENKIGNEYLWTLPIIFQIDSTILKAIPNKDMIFLKKNGEQFPFAFIKIQKIEKLKNIKKIAKLWFGTEDVNHPGVSKLYSNGDYIVSGRPFLLNSYLKIAENVYELTPTQSRYIFDHKGWHNIIGFHTRNVPHLGHEYIQKKALKDTNADGIFISPVTGLKKSGDFFGEPIIQCYNLLIGESAYKPYGAMIGSFNTHSRYSGPREAVFTAICRQNFGCNYFIVGRDHTGVGNYYPSDASMRFIDSLDMEIRIISFDSVLFEEGVGLSEKKFIDMQKNIEEISGSRIREKIMNDEEIPEYLMRPGIVKILKKWYKKSPNTLFHP